MVTTAAHNTSAGNGVREISPHDAQRELPERRLIDVREQHEFDAGHVTGATHIPHGELKPAIEAHAPDRAIPLTLYCAAGARSRLAATTLHDMGYTDIATMTGGFDAWRELGLPISAVADDTLTPAQRDRYSRHLLLPEVGPRGQRALLDARVLIIGAGGLGSPAALYLAAAGVGTLGIVDHDYVEPSNLQRQILHNETRVGTAKTASAAATLSAMNGDVTVEQHDEALTTVNCRKLFDAYDIIVNGCDNFPTRYLANDVAIFTATPLVDGSVHRFTGEATVILPGQSACYRCRYPSPPRPENAPSCSAAGVLGVLPGIVGSIQAAETIKLILRRGTPLAGRLLRVDGLTMTFKEYAVPRDPQCLVCGENPLITEPIDYDQFCSGPGPTDKASAS
jgi:molybdopterin/thiamine biosynthesis adenylyltransferase/rhodanese-related sulfurtransferase